MKANHGHYAYVHRSASATYVAGILEEIGAIPQIRGIARILGWADLEGEKDAYNWGVVDADLEACAAAGKQYVLIFDLKSADVTKTRAAPPYILTAEYGYGTFKTLVPGKPSVGTSDTFGEALKLWNGPLRGRIIAMLAALAARYEPRPSFEMLIVGETAMGNAIVLPTGTQIDGYYRTIAKADAAAKLALPNTALVQFINYPRDQLPALVASLERAGVGVGGPDVFLSDSGLAYTGSPQGAYLYYPLPPVAVVVSRENYFTTEHGGELAPPPIESLYEFARDVLQANYLLWMCNDDAPAYGWSRALEMLSTVDCPLEAATSR